MKGDSKSIGDYKYMEMKFTVEQRQKISARQQQAASILQMGRMELDMFTTAFIGASSTKVIDGRMVTPRGYRT